MYEEALTYFSKNPLVRKHFEAFFETTPHTISTAKKRHRAFNDLKKLKAEWAIRLLAKEMMIERTDGLRADDGSILTDDQIVALIEDSGGRKLILNDRKAAYSLNEMNLRGMPTDTQHQSQILAMRKWYIENEHHLGELMVEKWGDKAVLINQLKPEKNSLKNDNQKKVTNGNFMSAKSMMMSIIGISVIALVYFLRVKKQAK